MWGIRGKVIIGELVSSNLALWSGHVDEGVL